MGFEDDELPRAPTELRVATPPLDDASVAALQAYITALEAEIARARAAIAAKTGHRAAAEQLFGGGSR